MKRVLLTLCAMPIVLVAMAGDAIHQLTYHRPAYWIWDGIHPTPAGHRRMADLWMQLAGKTVKD